MTFRIEADSLHRLVYNSLLFDTKSAKAFKFAEGSCSMNTSDGQVYLEDEAPCNYPPFTPATVFIMGGPEAKYLEEWLRKAEGEVEIKAGDLMVFTATRPEGNPDFNSINIRVSFGEYAQQSDLVDPAAGHGPDDFNFAINPDRLRKLALIQPRDYPVLCELVVLDGIDPVVIQFSKGPSVRGTYATLSKV